jgi:hypothetical protein
MKARQAAPFLQQHMPTEPPWSPGKLWKLARNGVLPCVRVGQNYLFLPDALLRWIEAGGSGYAHGWRRKPGPKPGPKPKGKSKRAARRSA